MVSLKQAIALLDLKDDDMIYLASERFAWDAEYITIREIRNKMDMKHTMVWKIYPYHFQYREDPDDYEFIIKGFKGIKRKI